MIITFCNHKGGVGKTANCINFAYTASQSKDSVLIIDCDPQANCTARLGLPVSDKTETIINLLQGNLQNTKDAIQSVCENVDLIASSLALEYVVHDLHRSNFAEKRLNNALKQVQQNYDFILIDTPPALNKLTVNALYASDLAIVVVNRSLDAVSGLFNIIQLANEIKSENEKLKIKILRTFTNEKTKLTNSVLSDSLSDYKELLFETTIPEREAINQASITGKSLIEQDKHSSAIEAYKHLYNEVKKSCLQI